ncbi:MAG: BON domain-containing protein [Nannocystis sp.]|nr:BON domain-containing protein [Nannocystis sp.]MBA3548326.1 BON domain-containing protein [Nannocystis sp.]
MRIATVSIVIALGCLPACGGDGKVDADNTKRNARDRDEAALTPIDQGNSAADIELTQKIRQKVIADESLSSNARNIKIITKDGAVTLRGPVKDEAEKARVVAMVQEAAGQATVDVQLEAESK